MNRGMGWKVRGSLCGMVLAISTILGWPHAVVVQAAEEEAHEGTASDLDHEASTPEGTKRVTQKLATEFGVEEARITSLRDKGLGYGEAHHALSLSEHMPGGITDENVNTIMTMRQKQKMGWGEIAHALGTNFGSTAKRGNGNGAAMEPSASNETRARSLTRPGSSAQRGNSPGQTHGKGSRMKSQQGSNASGMLGAHPGNAFGDASGYRGNSSHAPGHNR